MKQKLFYSIITICLLVLSSCGTTKLESGLQQIELGMTKQQVASILGNGYKILGSGTTPDGDLETWRYIEQNVIKGSSNEIIIVNFLDGRLDEWHREYIPTPPANRENDKNDRD